MRAVGCGEEGNGGDSVEGESLHALLDAKARGSTGGMSCGKRATRKTWTVSGVRTKNHAH